MSDDTTTTASVRRVFKYGDHTFDDPGASFTVPQVQQHLRTFFPELAQATAKETTRSDGAVEITFVKQVTTKGL
jgi:PRTRC genetic system protein C